MTVEILLKYPLTSFEVISKRSLHSLLLNPFHIYSDHNFISGEKYYLSNQHQKLIPLRIIYTLFIYIISLFGIYILFRPNGPEGTWIFYNLFFLVTFVQLIYDLMFYFKFIDKDIGAKNSIVDLIFAFAAFIISVILIYGLSNKIYL